MTNEELQAHIAALRDALERGEIEQYIDDWSMSVDATMSFDGTAQYRIKPKPLECWVNVLGDEGFDAFLSKDGACMAADVVADDVYTRIAVHMREVTE